MAAPVRLDHELLDFGAGRRLERFGEHLVERPSHAAEGATRVRPGAWARADLRWERGPRGAGAWWPAGAESWRWELACGPFRLELRPTSSGQLGVFPEQAPNWAWLAERAAAALAAGRPEYRVLNLFAYTGGATLAALAAGAHVTHVDGARGAVAWARRNAERSGLANGPVRWLVDDAAAFAARELRRGRHYDAVVLDPPSYGHGPRGRAWQLETALPPLLATLVALGAPGGLDALLLTAHTTGLGPDPLRRLVEDALATEGRSGARPWAGPEVRPLELRAADGRALAAGWAVRLARA